MKRLILLVLAPLLAAGTCDPAVTVTPPDDPLPERTDRAVVLYGSFGADAVVATLDFQGTDLRDDLLALTGSDWALSADDDGLYVVGRFGTDSVRRYDGAHFDAPTLEFSAGSPSNPQEVVTCDGKLFVTRYGLTDDGDGGDVAIYDATSGMPLGNIDLSDFAEGTDGTGEPMSLLRDGFGLYVGLQRLDRDNGWTVDPVGKVVQIDCRDHEVTNSWDVFGNPSLLFHPATSSRVLVVGEGGVQEIDALTDTVTTVIDEVALGVDVLGLAGSGDDLIVVAESNDDSTNAVWCVDATTWESETLTTTTARNWGVRGAPDGAVWTLWVDHWDTAEIDPGGLRIFEPAACDERTAEPVALGADPIDVAFSWE